MHPRPPSATTRSTAATRPLAVLSALLALVLAGCTTPATELRVVVDTDVDPTVPFALTARVFRGATSDHMVMDHVFHRALPGDSAPDAGITLPASFTVIPGDTPRDGTVRIEVEADADGVLLRRILVAAFIPGTTGVLRVFLAGRCAEPATGCTSSSPCTVRALCEENGQTCGNQGVCVDVQVTPGTDLDGGFDDVATRVSCGGPGLECCVIGSPCGSDLQCVSGRCSACPAGSEACCASGAARPNGTTCTSASNPCVRPGTCTDGVCSEPETMLDGTECAPPDSPCGLPSVCMAGTCTRRTAPDGTECGVAPDPCSLPPACMAGACTNRRAPDGTVCAPPAGSCNLESVCMAGTCAARNVANGTVCAMATGGCMRDGVCNAGACTGTTALPDGTVCSMAGNPCQVNGTCRAGACSGTSSMPDGTVCAAATSCRNTSLCMGGTCVQRNLANGTVCAATSDPCKVNGTCNNGTCGAITNRPNGTVCVAQNTAACDAARTCSGGTCQPAAALPNGTTCRAAGNACELAATCSGGSCPANPTRANNYVISGTQRCCGGAVTNITTASNCGVCGLRCSGSCASRTLNGGTHHLCTCSSNAQCAPLSTCRTQTPNANLCACTSDAQCPGNATCVNVSFNPNYCN